MSNPITYRDLPTWKYQMETDWTYQTAVTGHPFESDFFWLENDGKLGINRGYCWDGPSGPTLDTKDFMRGSLVHDVLYQSIRLGLLPHDGARKAADLELDKILKKDGMFWFRRKYVYYALRAFASGAARSKPRPIKSAP